MSDLPSPFSPDYISEKPTTTAPTAAASEVAIFQSATERAEPPQSSAPAPFKRYGTGKPRREIIRGKITHG